MLRAAGLLDPGAAAAAWNRFRSRVAEAQEDRSARVLLPAVCRNLSRDGPPEPYLVRAYAEALGANARLLAAAAAALRVLAEASIPALVLKGTALLVAHYRDTGARPMSDVDLLVPEALVTQALDALVGAGWRGDPSRAWLSTQMHAGAYVDTAGRSLDVHRHATYEARYPEADAAFFAASIPVEVAGVPSRAMGAEDQLIHSVVHGLRWSIAPSNLWALDALTLLRGGALDPARVRSRAEGLGLGLALRRGLELAQSIFGSEASLEPLLRELRRVPARRAARVEHHFRVREPAGALGALPNLWFAHVRGAAPGRIGLRGFPAFLAQTWELTSVRALPGALLGKLLRRVPLGRS